MLITNTILNVLNNCQIISYLIFVVRHVCQTSDWRESNETFEADVKHRNRKYPVSRIFPPDLARKSLTGLDP